MRSINKFYIHVIELAPLPTSFKADKIILDVINKASLLAKLKNFYGDYNNGIFSF